MYRPVRRRRPFGAAPDFPASPVIPACAACAHHIPSDRTRGRIVARPAAGIVLHRLSEHLSTDQATDPVRTAVRACTLPVLRSAMAGDR